VEQHVLQLVHTFIDAMSRFSCLTFA
jgi:hypothetical protein